MMRRPAVSFCGSPTPRPASDRTPMSSTSPSFASTSAEAPLRGRRALVTGASRGIGRAVALTLGRAGATVHVLARTASSLEVVAGEILAAQGRAQVHPCDLTDGMAVIALLAEWEARGEVPDILVSNAGIFPLLPVQDTSPELFEQTLQANLGAPFRLVHALLPRMRAQGAGDIVTVGSVADRHIFGGNGAYSASKFGARALHEVLRAELVGTGVRCTLVSPAATDTPIWDPIDPDNTPGFPPRAAMLRPHDVADAVLWAITRPPHVNIDELRLSRS
ncbi:MAG TPA: SDR family NAD(P)-dependent oxidoreductase [Gemmatimonas aurantiaca]|uniref:SDR family NAD(P)-dependent oxidoreductase n=2 Tax=Gemmatimonas aurantiaca TaxID=173480 RepID=A0A3D4V665_9BACT|nr:SDR family NAD(P)-dependent oxidoreductase [Gemmatimonas aurantiaca]